MMPSVSAFLAVAPWSRQAGADTSCIFGVGLTIASASQLRAKSAAAFHTDATDTKLPHKISKW
jgi:hypothetical protein